MKRTAIKFQRGLSLIELMIAILIGSFISAGLLQLFVSSRQTYRVQESLSRLQEEGRFAINFLSRDLRMAGYWGCISDTTQIKSNLNPGSDIDNFRSAVKATDNTGLNDSDTISIMGVRGSGVHVVTIPASESASLKVTDNTLLNASDIVLVSDCDKGDIFQITNDPNTGSSPDKDELVHSTIATYSPGNATKNFQKIYGTDAQVYKLHQISYSLNQGKNGHPALFRSINGAAANELIPDIENFQVVIGEDTDNDGIANRYVAPSDSAMDWDKVVSLRVAIVIATPEKNITSEPLSYSMFGKTVTPTDKRLRRVMTTTIAIRNKLL
jgi:type IV pilus assembly protein PilW